MSKQPPKPPVVHIEDIKPNRYAKPKTILDYFTQANFNFMKNMMKVSADPKWETYVKFIGDNFSGDITSMSQENRDYVDTILKEIADKRASESGKDA